VLDAEASEKGIFEEDCWGGLLTKTSRRTRKVLIRRRRKGSCEKSRWILKSLVGVLGGRIGDSAWGVLRKESMAKTLKTKLHSSTDVIAASGDNTSIT
jgi:hypothetical protein